MTHTNKLTAGEIIGKAYNHKANFMTPEILENGFLQNGKYAYELSRGSGMFGKKYMYGVTVVTVETCKPEYDLSQGGFDDIEEAREYINQLNNRSK